MITINITNPQDLIDLWEHCEREDVPMKIEYRGAGGILASIRASQQTDDLVTQLKRTSTKPMNMREFLKANDQ